MGKSPYVRNSGSSLLEYVRCVVLCVLFYISARMRIRCKQSWAGQGRASPEAPLARAQSSNAFQAPSSFVVQDVYLESVVRLSFAVFPDPTAFREALCLEQPIEASHSVGGDRAAYVEATRARPVLLRYILYVQPSSLQNTLYDVHSHTHTMRTNQRA
jgi:hypothetical protein